MSDEGQAKRGEAAWKEQREAIAQRNASTQKTAQAQRKTRDEALRRRVRDDLKSEREQLEDLNARLRGKREAADG